MKRRLLVRGPTVQDIGYRMFLLNLAGEHGITGFFARNLGKDGVEVLYEGEGEKVAAFEDSVRRERPAGALVEKMDFGDYEGEVMDIEKFRSMFTTLQLGKIIDVGVGMLEKQDLMLEKQDVMLGKMDTMLEKQDQMLEKQDQMLEKQDLMLKKQDQMLGKQDTMLGKMDQMLEKQDLMLGKQDQLIEEVRLTRSDLKAEIQRAREDLRTFLDRKIEEIERRLSRLEEAVLKR